jgi:hypothetical protein
MPSAAQREADRYHSANINRSPSGRGHLLPPFSGSRVGYFHPQQEYYENQYDTREPKMYTESRFLAPPPAAKPRVPRSSPQQHQYDPRQHSPTTCENEEIGRHILRSRCASLPLRQQSIENVEPLDRAQSMSKPRKSRPTPLQIPPVLHRPQTPDDPLDEDAPYTPSILALYSPSQDQSPNSKTRSLPTYRFQASDFPATEFDKPLPSPWFQLSPEISSASISVFSPVPGSASSQSSISSFSHNLSDADYGLQESSRGDNFVGTTKRYATVSHLVPNVSTMGEVMSPRYF